MENDSAIDFTEDKAILFKKAYNNAVKLNLKEFLFNGKLVLTEYAKYVLEYLDTRYDLNP